jgi:ankyrin repeat protein
MRNLIFLFYFLIIGLLVVNDSMAAANYFSNDPADVRQAFDERPGDINTKNDRGHTPLYNAVINNSHITNVEFLLEQGANVNIANDYGWTPLHGAAVANARLKTINMLLAKGADINAKNKDDWTPLHDAADNNQLENVKLLLAKGADIKAKNVYGKTALDIANEKKYFQLAQLLQTNDGTSDKGETTTNTWQQNNQIAETTTDPDKELTPIEKFNRDVAAAKAEYEKTVEEIIAKTQAKASQP